MPDWIIRPAKTEDIPVLVEFRNAMFRDMGCTDETRLAMLKEATIPYLQRAIPAGAYRSWVAEANGEVIASGAFTYRELAPSYINLTGRQAYIASVYTLPQWRQQGIARAILQTILDTLSREGIPMAYLTASKDGHPIYEKMGFEDVVEMRIPIEPCPHPSGVISS